MSTKSTILLTEKEHWYHEMTDDSIYLELHRDSVEAYKYEVKDDGTIVLVIRMDSELGVKLKKLGHLCLDL